MEENLGRIVGKGQEKDDRRAEEERIEKDYQLKEEKKAG